DDIAGTNAATTDRLLNLKLAVTLKNPLATHGAIVVATTTPGDGSTDEVQTVTVPEDKNFTLLFGAQRTDAIAHDATDVVLRKALGALPDVGGHTTLSAGITGSDTTLTVVDGDIFPTSNFQIVIDNELIQVGSRTGNTLSSLTRGFGGITAKHDKDATVVNVDNITASHVSDGAGHIVWTITFTKAKGHQDVPQLVGETVDENRIDVGVLGSPLSHGKFLYDPSVAGTGTADNPATGFIFGTLAGGLGFSADVKPDGALAGLADDLSAKLAFTAASPDWFRNPPFHLDTGGRSQPNAALGA